VTINKDTFILQATWIETTHKLFTLTKVTKLTNEMQTDTLTGAYKKTYFNTHLKKMIKNKEEGVLVVLDLDNFKDVNDTHGHQVGDDVLREFAILIQKNIRGDDIFARWGGEEFLLLLQHTNIENAMKKIESLRKIVDAHTFTHVGHITSSFGVAKKEEVDDMHSLLQRADKALYEAKYAGKNKVVFKKI
jgi:diguanylate cyclase (GGDEF)-like protein